MCVCFVRVCVCCVLCVCACVHVCVCACVSVVPYLATLYQLSLLHSPKTSMLHA